MTKIGILGDVHADTYWFEFAMWKFNNEGINRVLQVGDFGIGQSNYNARFLKRANRVAKHFGVRVYITPGNHEDWDYINELHEEGNKTDDGWTILRQKNLLLAPRGHRWEWDGVSFVSLGGAPSVDRKWRVRQQGGRGATHRDRLWYAGEQITQEDVDRTVAGGYADVMVAHDAPMNVPTIEHVISTNPHGFAAEDLVYAQEGRLLMDQAFRGVSPRTFLHGHYHFRVDDMVPAPAREEFQSNVSWTHVAGFGCNQQDHSLGHYETDNKTAYHWNIMRDVAAYNRYELPRIR